jgi:hypothetical protein
MVVQTPSAKGSLSFAWQFEEKFLLESRLGEECRETDFPIAPPPEALFDPKKVVIVSNGR